MHEKEREIWLWCVSVNGSPSKLETFCIRISTDNSLQKTFELYFSACSRHVMKARHRNQYNTEKEIFFQLNNDMILVFFVILNSQRRVYHFFLLFISRITILYHFSRHKTRNIVVVVLGPRCCEVRFVPDNKEEEILWWYFKRRKRKVQRPPLRPVDVSYLY